MRGKQKATSEIDSFCFFLLLWGQGCRLSALWPRHVGFCKKQWRRLGAPASGPFEQQASLEDAPPLRLLLEAVFRVLCHAIFYRFSP